MTHGDVPAHIRQRWLLEDAALNAFQEAPVASGDAATMPPRSKKVPDRDVITAHAEPMIQQIHDRRVPSIYALGFTIKETHSLEDHARTQREQASQQAKLEARARRTAQFERNRTRDKKQDRSRPFVEKWAQSWRFVDGIPSLNSLEWFRASAI